MFSFHFAPVEYAHLEGKFDASYLRSLIESYGFQLKAYSKNALKGWAIYKGSEPIGTCWKLI